MQLSIPIELGNHEVERKQSLGAAIELCVEAAGLEPKRVTADLGLDKGQWSRWASGAEGVVWPRLEKLMDRCGNDAPVLWQVAQRGYDLHSLRRRESETERRCRLLQEENVSVRRVLLGGKA